MKRYLILLLVAVVATSCSTTYRVNYSQQRLDSYIGKTHQQLVRELGAPISDVTDGGDGYILVFEGNPELFDYSSRYAAKAQTLPKAQFYMNSQGVCYKVRAANTDAVKVTSVGGTIALVILILLIL